MHRFRAHGAAPYAACQLQPNALGAHCEPAFIHLKAGDLDKVRTITWPAAKRIPPMSMPWRVSDRSAGSAAIPLVH